MALLRPHSPRLANGATARVLFVDHETRLSGGQLDLVDLVRALQELSDERLDLHLALPGDGELAEVLCDEGVQTHAYAASAKLRATTRWDLGRRPRAVLGRLPSASSSANDLARIIRAVRPDVVHTNSLKAHLLALPGAKLARRPLVWHVRDIVDGGWLAEALRWAGVVGPTRLACISEAAAAPFTRGHLASKVRVIYNGVRPAPPAFEEIEAARARCNARGADVVVGIVGQIAHWKGQDVFIEAARRLAPRHPRVRFVVVGDCLYPQNEAEFAARCRHRFRDLLGSGRGTWLGSVRPVEPVMAALDVLVHASRCPEPFGRVVVEAMALGVPVIASTLGAGPELVGDSGELVAPGDPGALAVVLERLIGDDWARERMARAGRERAARFDISSTGRTVLELWREIGVPVPSAPRRRLQEVAR